MARKSCARRHKQTLFIKKSQIWSLDQSNEVEKTREHLQKFLVTWTRYEDEVCAQLSDVIGANGPQGVVVGEVGQLGRRGESSPGC